MPRYVKTTVYVGQLAQEAQSEILTDYHFEDCTVVGPAVLVPITAVRFERCQFDGTPGGILWELPPPISGTRHPKP